jgi:hypothetical protein
MSKVPFLTPQQLEREHPLLHAIFFLNIPPEPTSPKSKKDRLPHESLHDYLIRKNIVCFCNKCRQQKLI